MEQPSAGPTGSGWFATTHWSVVLAAGDQANPSAHEALEKLCRTYWQPLYCYVRRRGYGAADAEDLTQDFFARLLLRDFPQGIQPEGGKFRSYLLAALQRFVTNQWRNARAAKRGGGKTIVSLEELKARDCYASEPADQMTPEALFNRQWASALLALVKHRLSEEFAEEGKAEVYGRLCHFLTGAERSIPYSALGRELGWSEGAVKMAVHRMRRRYGQLLRREISQTVSSPAEVEEEIRFLLAAV